MLLPDLLLKNLKGIYFNVIKACCILYELQKYKNLSDHVRSKVFDWSKCDNLKLDKNTIVNILKNITDN